MSRRIRLLIGAVMGSIVTAGVLVAFAADAETFQPQRKPYAAISTMTAAAFNGGVWTGWISMGNYGDICFDYFHDYTGNAGVSWRCESSDSSSTTADAGYDVTSVDIAGGTGTSTVFTVNHATGADARWSRCFTKIPHDFINCKADDTSGNNANDKITVRYSLQNP